MSERQEYYRLAMSYRDLLIFVNDSVITFLDYAFNAKLDSHRISLRVKEILEAGRHELKKLDKGGQDETC